MLAEQVGKIFVTGHVLHQTTGVGLAGLRVEAWDRDMVYDDFLASAVTDDNGDFQLKFTSTDFEDLYLDRQPHLFFKIFKAGKIVDCTEHSTAWQTVHPGKNEFTIELDCQNL